MLIKNQSRKAKFLLSFWPLLYLQPYKCQGGGGGDTDSQSHRREPGGSHRSKVSPLPRADLDGFIERDGGRAAVSRVLPQGSFTSPAVCARRGLFCQPACPPTKILPTKQLDTVKLKVRAFVCCGDKLRTRSTRPLSVQNTRLFLIGLEARLSPVQHRHRRHPAARTENEMPAYRSPSEA